MLIWLFGDVKKFKVTTRGKKLSLGELQLERANVEWFLSLSRSDLPDLKQKFFRSMTVNDAEVKFDNVFDELHIESYKKILSGNGYGIEDSRKSIKLVEEIRES